MNSNDNQSIAVLSSIIYLKDEMHQRNVDVDLVEHAFDVQQQVLQFTHDANEKTRVAEAACAELHKMIYDNAISAGLSEDVARNSNMAVVYMQSSVVELRKAIRVVHKRLTIYCAIAAIVGAITAWSIPLILDFI